MGNSIHPVVIDLFSGCGGLDIGTQLAGVKVISSLDFEPAAIIPVHKRQQNTFFSFIVFIKRR